MAVYERPIIIKNPVGLMNKVGRRASLNVSSAIDGAEISTLCEQYGSPLFVFSERQLRKRLRYAKAAFVERWPRTTFCWSYKTNYLDAICAVFHQEGSLAEVVSGMEYDKARRLGVPGSSIVFNGPAKTYDELARATAEGAAIHADHVDELHLLERVARQTGRVAEVGIRVSLDAGIVPRWGRFGFELESGGAKDAVRRIQESPYLRLGGYHTHIGTFILDAGAYARAVTKLSSLAQTLHGELGAAPRYLDLGGGFASTNTLAGQYHSGALTPPIEEYAEEITSALNEAWRGREAPHLLVETGRSLVDEAGTLLATVVANKRLPDGKRALIIDAGVNVLFTSWWYRLNIAVPHATEALTEDTAVYGPLCMNIDCVRESLQLPDLRVGEHVAISPVGAYAFTQSMQFIQLRPACVLISPEGGVELIRRREVLDDLVRPEYLPERLRLGDAQIECAPSGTSAAFH